MCRGSIAPQTAVGIGQQAHGANAEQTLLIHMFILHLELGRVGEVIGDLSAYVEQSPLPAWRAALALAYAALDRREEAAQEFASLTHDGLAEIPQDSVWLATLGQLSQVAAKVGAVEPAQSLYPLLLPYAERMCVVGGGVMCLGPVSWFLGLLAATIGDIDGALDHLEDALDRSRGHGSLPFTARVETTLAMSLLSRGADGDVERAGGLLDEAARTATELGMAQLAGEAGGLLSAATAGSEPGACV